MPKTHMRKTLNNLDWAEVLWLTVVVLIVASGLGYLVAGAIS